MSDDCKLSPEEREALGLWLDRKPMQALTGVEGADSTEFRRVTWRDLVELEPWCEKCEGRGHATVPAPDGSFGWIMAPCKECNQ